ncbi:MAG: hypothetical protein MZV65_00690 [Chromatiales bacterium]|nr:hypothetical protein [Chromatiales bacterium]
MNPSLSKSTPRPIISGEKGTPFSQEFVQLTKQEYIQLKWDRHYWRRQHDRALAA